MSWLIDFIMRLMWQQRQQPPPPPASGNQLLVSDGTNMYAIHEDGSQRINFTEKGRTPSWTKAGTKILYVSTDGHDLKLMDPDGRNAEVLATGFSSANKPMMVGGRIILTDAVQGTDEAHSSIIYLLNADGSGRRMLCNGLAPYLSPDATWATYTMLLTGHREIARINTDGSSFQQLTFPTGDTLHPDGNASAISPDGQTIAVFCGSEERGQDIRSLGQRDIALMPAAGGALKVLLRSTPATPNFPIDYPKNAILWADNPFYFTDAQGQVWVGYDLMHPDASVRGTWLIKPDGTGNHRVCADFRGAGAVPMRVVS